ncbi:MAG: sodium/glutamate symporter [Cyanobacteriota bacterium]|nr:sodium/glutamate symporter [Cyanobacteriota bacterium]
MASSGTPTADVFGLEDAFYAFVIIAILVLLGRFVRQQVPLLQALYIPSSIVAGGLALLLGPEVLGAIAGADSPLGGGLFSAPIREVWSQSPGVFINVVFAALFLGETIPRPIEIWRKAAPQVAFGQTIAWGQYVVGLLLVLTVLTPVFGLNPIAGALIEIAFEGGHGTAAGMADTFQELGFPEGGDLALGLATVGIVTGIVSGILLANWGRRKGYVQVQTRENAPETPDSHSGGEEYEDPATRAERARLMRDLLVDPITLNLGFVGLAVVIGWVILKALVWIESVTWGAGGFAIMGYVPLFPMTLVGGILLQLVLVRLRLAPLISRPLINRIAGVALDVTIVTALASLSLKVLGGNLVPFLLLSVFGILWNVGAFIFLAPRILPTYWFERGLGDMGQSMGVTATGILLLRMVDPENRSGAFESFAYKQLFFEPIVGGGLYTAAAPALIARFGPVTMLLANLAVLAAWLVFGILNCRKPSSS